LKRLGAAMLGRVRPAVLVERPCRGWLADRDVTWVLRTARPVEAGRLQCQLTARRVRMEDDEEAMPLRALCVVRRWLARLVSNPTLFHT
jgi:hypothetical protein